MSKGSVRLLLSGASSIAITAAAPALAGQSFGPGNVTPIVISADTNFVEVNGATVAADALGSAFIIQSGVTISDSGVLLASSTFLGNVTNNGVIVEHQGAGWSVSGSTILGALTNNGTVTGGDDVAVSNYGLFVGFSNITGGINNTGTIRGGVQGTAVPAIEITNSTIGDDITNSGTIAGGTGTVFSGGLLISDTDVLGALRNTSTGSITGGASPGVANAIDIRDSLVAEGIYNDGQITGGTAGTERSAIRIVDSTVAGGLHNTGTIRAGAGSPAIFIAASTFSGGIENSNLIAGAINVDTIAITGGTFSGGIHNAEGGSIQGNGLGTAIRVTDTSTFAGGILNEGEIEAGDGAGIKVDTSKFGGTIDNKGLITAIGTNGAGIRVTGLVSSGIFNSGTINAPIAIDINDAAEGQTITQTDGAILGDVLFSMHGDSFFVGEGGFFRGKMKGTNSDNDDITVKNGTWSAEGSGEGLGDITVASGTGVFGGRFRGDLAGSGFDVTGTTNFITDAGRAYIDDDSKMAFSNDLSLGGEGSVEYLLSSDLGRHGTLISNDDAFLGGRIAGYFAWNSFAGLGNTQDFTYLYLVQTGDLVGTFDNEGNVDTNSIFFTAQVVHRDDQFVDLNAHRIGFDEIVTNPTANQQAVGDALEQIFANGGAPFTALEDPNGDGIENPQETSEGLFSALFQLATAGEVADAYGSLDGHNNAAIFQTTFTIASLLDRNIQSRLDDVRDRDGARTAGEPQRYAAATIIAVDSASGASRSSSGWSAWARAFGSWGDAEGDAANEGFEQDSRGFGFGVDYAPSGRSLIGFAGQFASTDVEFDRPAWAPIGADANIDSWQVALYGYHSFGTLFIDGNASATFNDYSTRRFDLWGQPIVAAYDATVYSVYGELGADLNSGRFNIQPYAGFGFRHADFDNFVERCPLFCLAVAPEDAESLYSALGVRASTTYRWGRTPISPEIRFAWQHEFSDDRGAFDAAFVGAPDSPFHVEGQKFAEDKFIVGAGISVEVQRNFVLFADYNGTFSNDFDAHSVAAGLRVTW